MWLIQWLGLGVTEKSGTQKYGGKWGANSLQPEAHQERLHRMPPKTGGRMEDLTHRTLLRRTVSISRGLRGRKLSLR